MLKEGRHALAQEEIKLVEDFFNSNDKSRMCPGETLEGRELKGN